MRNNNEGISHMNFGHIVPINHLDKVKDRPFHLVLAHLVEESPVYAEFYMNEKKNNPNTTIILDNSAFEMFKQGRPMFESSKLIDLGHLVSADYIVMSDYPGEHSSKTVKAAEDLSPKFRDAGFGTFYVPQSEIGNLEDLTDNMIWAMRSGLVDYVGVSILAVPNAYGVERNNKLQRYLSRYSFINHVNKKLDLMSGTDLFIEQVVMDKKIHFLGMVDGPNEISLVKDLAIDIDTWDSSAAVWAGLHNISFDSSPTGLINGKFEKEVDFDSKIDWNPIATNNIKYIDELVKECNDDQ